MGSKALLSSLTNGITTQALVLAVWVEVKWLRRAVCVSRAPASWQSEEIPSPQTPISRASLVTRDRTREGFPEKLLHGAPTAAHKTLLANRELNMSSLTSAIVLPVVFLERSLYISVIVPFIASIIWKIKTEMIQVITSLRLFLDDTHLKFICIKQWFLRWGWFCPSWDT